MIKGKRKSGRKWLSLQINHIGIMDIQTEKLRLIEWLAGQNNATVIKRFVALKAEQEKDWWDQLSKEERAEIEEGLTQADRGEVVSHKDVMARYKRWR